MKNRLIFILFFCLLFNLTIFSQQSAQTLYDQGLEQLKNVKYDLAIASFSEAIKINPEFTKAYLQRAKARQNNQRDLEGAMKDVEKAIEINPSLGELYYERALIRFAQLVNPANSNREIPEEKFAALNNNMLADLDLAINYGFKTKEAYLRRAELKCHDMGKCAEAIQDFDAVIIIDPDNLLIYVSRANAKSRTEDFRGAIADLKYVVNRYNNKDTSTNAQRRNIDSSSNSSINTTAVSLALINLGGLVMHTENKDLALDAYNQAIAIVPNYSSAYEARGYYKIIFGDIDDAILDFNKAIEFRDENALAYIYRGIALSLKDKVVEAQKDLDKGIELAPHLKNQIGYITENLKSSRLKFQPKPQN